MQLKQHKHPGMGLNVDPRAAAVGVKGYGAPGPTQCSKLKVYRPKTAVNLKRRESHEVVRPKTSQPSRKEHMSEIELALCWDYKPVNPADEPKRSPHIDGSNGSAAPAVFAMVHQPSPSPEEIRPSPRPIPMHSRTEKRISVESLKSVSRESAERARSRPKTAWGSDDGKSKMFQDRLKRLQERSNPSAVMDIINNNQENNSPNILPGETRKSSASSHAHHSRRKSLSGQGSVKSSELNSQKLMKEKHYQSSPNLTTAGEQTNGKNGKNRLLNSRPCMACDMKTTSSVDEAKKTKSDYKMAFKAGKPNNGNGHHDSANTSQELSSTSSRQQTKHLTVPKMKAPFAKKSYSIGTLAPPFSFWPGTTGQDYPEHWRLASVYQHSFKPVELRRKPLLQSVFQ